MRELEQDIAAAVAQAVAAPAGPSQAVRPALRSRKRIAWYLAVSTCALVALLGASFMATSLLSESGARTEARAGGKGEIRIGRVDLPDLKDGVPQISASGGTVRAVPIGPSTTASIAAPAPSRASLLAAAPIGPAAAAPMSQAVAAQNAPVSSEPSIRSLAAAPAAPLPVIRTTNAPAAPAPPPVKVASVAVAPAPAVATAAVVPVPPARVVVPRVTAATDASPTPLPPAAPTRTAPTRTASVPPSPVRPKPALVAAVARPKPVTLASESATDPTTTAAITAAKPVREEEHYDVFGMKVPTLGATANRIRDGVGAIGNAVTRLPERF